MEEQAFRNMKNIAVNMEYQKRGQVLPMNNKEVADTLKKFKMR